MHIDFCLYQFKILHQVNSHRIKWILWLGPQKSVSDTPIESKKFRRLDEIFKKFSTNKKFIWVIFGLAMVLTKKKQDGGSAWHGGLATCFHDIFLWKSTYLCEKIWILTIEREGLIIFNLILVEKKSFVDQSCAWKVSYTISMIYFVLGHDNGPMEK